MSNELLLFLVLMVVGTFFLGVSDIERKRYLTAGLDERVLVGVSWLFIGLLMVPLVLLFGIPQIGEYFWAAYIGTTLLNVVSQAMFAYALRLSDASVIAPLRLIVPPLTIVTGFLFLREVPSSTGVFGIFVTMAGLWYLLFSERPFSLSGLHTLRQNKGVVWGLLGSVLFALSFPLDKITVVESSAIFATGLVAASVGLVTLVGRSFSADFRRALRASLPRWKQLVWISILSGTGIVLTNQALNYSLAAYASSLKRLQALWTVALSGKLLGEKNVHKKLFATAIMFAGILLSVFWQ